MSRALVFDIGNTRVKWGVLEGESLRRTGVVSHADIKERGFDALTRKLPRRADRLFASNVKGPNFGRRFARAVGMHCDGDVHYAHSQKSGWGVTSAYKQPRTMGVDRWVALVAARAISTGPTLVVDAGTAITIDALDRDGNHLGGQIIPGLDLMADALSRDTSDIGRARKTNASTERQCAAVRRLHRQIGCLWCVWCRRWCDRARREAAKGARQTAENHLDRGRRVTHSKRACGPAGPSPASGARGTGFDD